MKKRFSVVQAKEVPGRDKPVWLRHGIAFQNDKGISIKLEGLPLPNKEGEVWLKLFEDDGTRQQKDAPAAAPADKIEDEIPF